MDADSVPELVVQFRSSYDNLVIRKDGNHYYGYLFGIREMNDIRTDGTFSWAGGAGYIGCSRLRFNGVQYETVELWHKDEGYSYGNYYVDGKAVTKEAYLAATANQAQMVVWAEWDDGNYVDYADLLKTKYSHQEIEYALRDLNADGREELLVLEQGTTLSVYTMKTGYTQLLVEQDFVSGTSRFLMTGDAAYPGLIYFCVGGGKDRYYYLSLDKVEDRQFIFTELWTDNYAFAEEGEEGRVTILSNDAKLVELSRVAYQNNQDLFSVSLPPDKTDGTTMTDAELLALCKGKIQCAQQIEGWYKGGSHHTTTIPEGTATTLLNGETYVIEYDYYPLTDDFYLDGAMHSGAVITAAALKQQIESVYTTAFAHDRYYDDGYTWVVYNGDVYHVTADGVIPEVVDPNSVTDIQAKKDTITFRVKTYSHGDEENIREMKLTYIEGDWKFDELV